MDTESEIEQLNHTMKDRPLTQKQAQRCNKFPCDSIPRYKVPEFHKAGKDLTYKEAYEAIELACGVTYKDDKGERCDFDADVPKTRVLNKRAYDRLSKLNNHYRAAAHKFLVAFAENLNRELAEVERIAREMKAKDAAGDTTPVVANPVGAAVSSGGHVGENQIQNLQ